MLLDLPDVRQREDFDCGEAAVDTALRFLGVRTVTAMVIADPIDGLDPPCIEAGFRRAGLEVQSGTMTVADLQHHTRRGRPVLCPIALHGGHWVVVRGVERGKVYFHCPTSGGLDLSIKRWLEAWRDSTRAAHDFDRWGIAVGRTSSN